MATPPAPPTMGNSTGPGNISKEDILNFLRQHGMASTEKLFQEEVQKTATPSASVGGAQGAGGR